MIITFIVFFRAINVTESDIIVLSYLTQISLAHKWKSSLGTQNLFKRNKYVNLHKEGKDYMILQKFD